MYFVSLCLWPILKRVYYFLMNCLRKGKTGRLRSVGVVDDDSDKHYNPYTAEREPLLFQESVNSSVFNALRNTDCNYSDETNRECCDGTNHKWGDVTNREYCDVPEPRLPTSSSVGISGSATS